MEKTHRAVPSVEFLPVELDGRRVGHVSVDTPGERDEWEMHPQQDELLYLLGGAVDVFLRADPERSEQRTVRLRPGDACVIPTGMWHRQVVVDPCEMLFVTGETLHRPYAPPAGWSEDTELRRR